MIIDNGAPVSVEMWDWFSSKVAEAGESEGDYSVKVLNGLFKGARNYRTMDAGAFWQYFDELFRMATGVSTFVVDKKYTVADISDEIEKIRKVALWWALTEDHDGAKAWGLLDTDYIDNECEFPRTNHVFRYKVFYMLRTITQALAELQTWRDLDMSTATRQSPSATSKRDLIKEIIKETCVGDQDEFILYTIAFIQSATMTTHHDMLAHLIRFKRFGKKDFGTPLPPAESWRFLFPTHFDGVDEVFVDFFRVHENNAVMYFLQDYLGTTMNIKKIPFYNVYCNDDTGATVSRAALDLVDMPAVQGLIKKTQASHRG
jgi:hypothetical protein